MDCVLASVESALRNTKEHLQRAKDPVALWRLSHLLNALHKEDVIEVARQLRQHLWERLHDIPWIDLPHELRHAYGIASYVLGRLLVYHQKACLSKVFSVLDDGILMGADTSSRLIHDFIALLEKEHRQDPIHASYTYMQRKILLDAILSPALRVASCKRPMLYSSLVDTYTFYAQYLTPRIPVIFTDAMEDWPALKKWSDLNYIRRGHRTVPVEIGANYLHAASGQKLLTIDSFINEYIACIESDEPSSKKCRYEAPIAYLAQHRLLDQISALAQDVIVPEYTAIVDEEDSGEEDIIINAWFGPVGTVSPLHNDCYHNLLAQVHGYKYVRLYSYEYTSHVYPREGLYRNNSQVDMIDFDASHFPLLASAPYQEFILHAGEMLYIPRWCWHYIAAVDMDFVEKFESRRGDHAVLPVDNGFCWSVSFWWGDRTLPPT